MPKFSTVQVRVICASFLGMAVSTPALYSVFPLLLGPTTQELGWGRSVLAGAFLLATPLAAANFILVGRLVDRYGPRSVLIPGYLLCGTAIALMSQMNGSLIQMFVLQTLALLCATITTGVAYGKVIAQHFTSNRGTVLGICLGAGGGLGMTLMPQVGAVLLDHLGWRGTYVGVGFIALIVGSLAAWALPRQAPKPLVVDTVHNPEGIDARHAIVMPSFLLIAAFAFLSCMALNGIGGHLAALVTDRGHSPGFAAVTLSAYAMSMMAGQFAIGFLLDRIKTPRIGLPIFMIVLAGIVLLHQGSSDVSLLMGAVLLGAGAGSEYGLLPYILTRYFGLKAFGLLYGLIYAITLVGTGLGPFIMGLSFDLSASYAGGLMVFEVALLITIGLVSRLPAYRFAVDRVPASTAGKGNPVTTT